MCGIIGIIGKNDAAPLLIDGLKRLEYRGYDSAGIATLVKGLRHAQKNAVEYGLIDPSEQVRAVIELAQLDRLFSIQSGGE